MNLTCSSAAGAAPSGGAAVATKTYTIIIDEHPKSAPQTPAGSTTVVPTDPNATYNFVQTLPNGNKLTIPVNGEGVLVYSTP